MSNTLLTPTQVTRKALMVLHQKLNFVGSINRGYDDSFAKDGAKIGSTLNIRVPNQYIVRTGATLSAQDISESSIQLQVSTQKGFDTTGTIVDAMHGLIRQGGALLPGDKTVLNGLPRVTTAITAPLTIGAGIAGTMSDIHNGVPPDAAILGNAARAGLVVGAGALGETFGGPLGGPAAAYAANRYLPDSATIGRGLIKSITTPPGPFVYFPM